MSLSDNERLELHALCDARVDGASTPAQFERLQALLRASPEARASYVRLMALSASLLDYAGEMQADAPTGKAEAAPPPATRRWLAWGGGLAAAALLLVALGVGLRQRPDSGERLDEPEAVAHLSGQRAGQWRGPPPAPGGELRAGERLELSVGYAEVTFDSGAQLVLTGPCVVVIRSAWEAGLEAGSVTVRVPPEALGFRVQHAQVEVVDLGTEFSMVAGADGAAEVFVLKGSVEARPCADPGQPPARLLLAERQARRFAPHAVTEVADRERKLQRLAREVRLDSCLQPAGAVHWSFDRAEGAVSPARIEGRVAGRFDAELAGGGPGAGGGVGRWAGALPCAEGRHASAPLPAFVRRAPYTVACWVRIPDGVRLSDSGAVVAWRAAGATDAPPFSLTRNDEPGRGVLGALRCSVGRSVVVGSTGLCDGRWHHVAVVVRRGSRSSGKLQVKSYVDGKLENVSARYQAKREDPGPRRLRVTAEAGRDRCWIGRLPSSVGAESGFRGDIDELVLVDRALTASEIRHLKHENRLPAAGLLADAQ